MAKLNVVTGVGFSKEEAAKEAGFNAPLKYDATIAYNTAKDGVGFSLDAFLKEYLETKLKGIENVGITITLESAKKDVRQRPYKLNNVLSKGRRKYESKVMLVDQATLTGDKVDLTGAKIYGFGETKSEAEALAKTVVTREKINLVGVNVHTVATGGAVAFTVDYTPTLGTKEGEYIFASLEA